MLNHIFVKIWNNISVKIQNQISFKNLNHISDKIGNHIIVKIWNHLSVKILNHTSVRISSYYCQIVDEMRKSSTQDLWNSKSYFCVEFVTLLPVKFQRISAMSGRGIEDYNLTDEHLSPFFFLPFFIGSFRTHFFQHWLNEIIDIKLTCSNLRLVYWMLQDRQSFKLGPASMDTNVAINFQLSHEFPEILPHQSLHLANKIWIWFSEDIKRALNMGAGTKEVATIEALPDKVKSVTRAVGTCLTLSFHITHIFPLKNISCVFHRSCWGCFPSWSTRRWWSTLWCQRSGGWLPRSELLWKEYLYLNLFFVSRFVI